MLRVSLIEFLGPRSQYPDARTMVIVLALLSAMFFVAKLWFLRRLSAPEVRATLV